MAPSTVTVPKDLRSRARRIAVRALPGLLLLLLAAGSVGADGEKGLEPKKAIKASDHLGAKRFAVLIGINDYKDAEIPDLKYSENDVKGLYDTLRDPNICEIPKENIALLTGKAATTANIRKAISKMRNVPADSTVFIYFSGHGAKEGENSYWVTHDSDKNDLFSTAIGNTWLQHALTQIRAKRIVVLLDCCYAAALAKKSRSMVDMEAALARFGGAGRATLSAAGSTQEAIEVGDIKRGVFTHFLVEGLKGRADTDKNGIVALTELATYIDDNVTEYARKHGGSQRPVVDYQGVREPSRFLLSIDPKRLRRAIEETERDRKTRTRRLAALKQLLLDKKISLENHTLGKRLLEAMHGELVEHELQHRKEFEALADGKLAPEDLERALDAIRPAGPAVWRVPDRYKTIQRALRASIPGDTILIAPGVHVGSVKLKVGVSLRGEDRDRCVLRQPEEGEPLVAGEGVTRCRIEQLTLEGTQATKKVENAPPGILLRDSTVEIQNCVVRKFPGNGIEVDGSTGTSRIVDCVVRDMQASGIVAGGKGVSLHLTSVRCLRNTQHGVSAYAGASLSVRSCTCTDNKGNGIMVVEANSNGTIEGSTTRGNGIYGIAFGDGAAGSATGNTCTKNKEAGVGGMGDRTDVRFVRNRCENNEKAGIFVGMGATGVVENNDCHDNAWRGIEVGQKGTSARLVDNRCRQNQNYGIWVFGGASAHAEGNTCTDNKVNGIYVIGKGTRATLKNNTCSRNVWHGISYDKGAIGTAENNTCSDNKMSGFWVGGAGTKPVLRRNITRLNKRNGIMIDSGASVRADSNTCAENRISGIAVHRKGTRAVLLNNVCSDNKWHGIEFGPSTGGLIDGNTCNNNTYNGITIEGAATRPRIRRNTIRNNGEWGIGWVGGARPNTDRTSVLSGNGKGRVYIGK